VLTGQQQAKQFTALLRAKQKKTKGAQSQKQDNLTKFQVGVSSIKLDA
jgi:hypothetical protein